MTTTYEPGRNAERLKQALETFAISFIRKSFRARFLHEAINKPEQLSQRGLHVLFDESLSGTPEQLPTTGEFWILEQKGFTIQGWESGMALHLLSDGGLIIACEGRWFWARSEPGRHEPGFDYHAAVRS